MMTKISIVLLCVFSAFSCTKTSMTNASLTGGSSPDLTGTKWRIYQYKDATTSNPQPRSDTLIFKDATNYKFNNQSYSYYLAYGDYTHLTLHSTPFGDIDGIVPNNFIQNGEIIGVPFTQVKASGGLTYSLWMKKL